MAAWTDVSHTDWDDWSLGWGVWGCDVFQDWDNVRLDFDFNRVLSCTLGFG